MSIPAIAYTHIREAVERSGDDLEEQKLRIAANVIGFNLTIEGTVDAVQEICAGNRHLDPLNRWIESGELAELVADNEDFGEGRGNFVVIQNYNRRDKLREPRSMADVIGDVQAYTQGAFKCIDGVLFVDAPPHGFHWFDRNPVAGVFGYLRSLFKVAWSAGGSFVSMAELVAELRRTAPRFDAIEMLPHEPLVPNIYYRGDVPQPGDGSHLRWLVSRFSGDTTVDGELIKAAFITPAWGGPAGRRPLFVFTSDHGRGAGKTALLMAIAHLYGGALDISPGEDIGVIKQRLLSAEGQTKRILAIDNVKSLRLSWAELEALITSPVISGKRMYVGEGERPNLLTPMLTVNGASFSTDIAQRAIVIKLSRPDYTTGWWETTLDYIDQHREQIIGDIIAVLRAEPQQLEQHSRWADWEQSVLARLPNPVEAQRVILERQGESNCEQDEAEIVEQYFSAQLEANNYNPKTAQVRIPVSTVAEWFNAATNDRMKTVSVSRRLNQMIEEGQMKRLAPDTSRTHGRRFIYTGPEADVIRDSIVTFTPLTEQLEVTT
jgi:hypothetical protein